MLDPVSAVPLRAGRVLRTLYPESIRGISLRHLAKLGSDDQRSSDEMYDALYELSDSHSCAHRQIIELGDVLLPLLLQHKSEIHRDFCLPSLSFMILKTAITGRVLLRQW